MTSWIALLGTSVDSKAAEITFEIAMNDSVDSFPPKRTLDFILQVRIELTFQNGSIARLNSKRSNVGNDFGTGFKND